MNFCHIAASCLLTYTSVAFYTLHYGSISRGVTKGARGRNSTGAESLWGRWNTAGAPNACGGAKKSKQCHKHFLQYSTFSSERPQVRTWGRQTCFLSRAPSILVMPLSIRRLVPSRNSSTHFYVAKLRCRQTADSRMALATALKLVSRFEVGRLKNLESVTSFPYYIPVFTAAFPFPFKAVTRQ